MRSSMGRIARVRELWPALLIALTVALFSTLAGSIFDKVHNVDAEEIASGETAAAPGPDDTQLVTAADWGVRFTAPLAPELPTLKYTTRAGDTIGLSSADLEKQGPACIASRGGLGALLRFPAGGFAKTANGDPSKYFIAKINGYDYAYQKPQNACSDTKLGGEITNREVSIIFAALDSLVAVPVP